MTPVDRCATCGTRLERGRCPHSLQHATTIREAGFAPDERGAPSRPGLPSEMSTAPDAVLPSANTLLDDAIIAVRACFVGNAVSLGDVRYNQKLRYVLDDLEALRA